MLWNLNETMITQINRIVQTDETEHKKITNCLKEQKIYYFYYNICKPLLEYEYYT